MTATALTEALHRAERLESQNDLPGAFAAYEAALGVAPDSPLVARRLANLAFRLGDYGLAEKFYAHLLRGAEVDAALICGYASVLRELGRCEEAVDLLKPVVAQNPEIPQLWRALGEVLAAQQDNDNALIFYNEALRLAPDDAATRMLRGWLLFEMGHETEALDDLAAVSGQFDDADDDASAAIAHAQLLLATGDLAQGWAAYEARYRYGATQEVHYALWSPHWRPGESLAGRRLLVCAEQGLGDEVLFASLLPDVLRDLGPDGELTLAVEPRLVPLFARSFPQARVIAHRTRRVDGLLQRSFPDFDQNQIDQWALMGDFLSLYRARLSDFPTENVFLTPDPARVAHWRAALDGMGAGPKIGVLWKSLKSGARRDPYFAPFAAWRDVLTTPGARFVNLQYGDTAEETRLAQGWGAPLLTLPTLDVKDDLDDLAAACRALDLIIAPPNAASNIAAASGAPLWLVTTRRSWTQLGAPDFPWYPSARVFQPADLSDWSGVMREIRDALIARFSL
ncbi:MAG: tetratricopeptide repeat protein [Asticcacaulis sp.]|uniref:tetratricopeptide repeat protein n=1 Tax=Asticcacaulis sp. TaxID=1872648 RepID=UPI003F7C8522